MTTAIQLEDLLLAAKQGNIQAQNQVGLFYLTGESLSQNIDRAWYWFNEAAKRGFEEARLNLGKMYRDGLVKDFTDDMSQATTEVAKALYECRRAALREGMPLLTTDDEVNEKVRRIRSGED